MEYLREICNQYSKWRALEDYMLRIEAFKEKDGVLVLENCKELIESICKTILDDLNEDYYPTDSVQSLVSKTCNKIACLPNTGDLARSFITVAQKLGEFRNSHGGHGQSVHRIEQSKIVGASISFMINTIEQLAIFLITVYQEEYPQHVKAQLRYTDYEDFNGAFDEINNEIEIGQYGPYSPSEILFYVDKNAYDTELTIFKESYYD